MMFAYALIIAAINQYFLHHKMDLLKFAPNIYRINLN